jgi:hypothetical protein
MRPAPLPPLWTIERLFGQVVAYAIMNMIVLLQS